MSGSDVGKPAEICTQGMQQETGLSSARVGPRVSSWLPGLSASCQLPGKNHCRFPREQSRQPDVTSLSDCDKGPLKPN